MIVADRLKEELPMQFTKASRLNRAWRSKRKFSLLVILTAACALLILGACGAKKEAPKDPNRPIGVAEMKEDGTIFMWLRAEGDGIIGDAFFSYPPSHEKYQETLDHLGGLEPGEGKPVPPWPSKPSKK